MQLPVASWNTQFAIISWIVHRLAVLRVMQQYNWVFMITRVGSEWINALCSYSYTQFQKCWSIMFSDTRVRRFMLVSSIIGLFSAIINIPGVIPQQQCWSSSREGYYGFSHVFSAHPVLLFFTRFIVHFILCFKACILFTNFSYTSPVSK